MTILGDRIAVRRVETPSVIAIPETVRPRGPWQFEADVVAVGASLSEDIAIGDRVLIEHRGEQETMHEGQLVWIVSTLAVMAKIERVA